MDTELPFTYDVVRSRKRRTASLMIDQGRVQVRVPALVDSQWVEAWVRSKADWVVPRLKRQTDALSDHVIEIEQGGRFVLNGRTLWLEWQRGGSATVEIEGDRLRLQLSTRVRKAEPEAVRLLLKRWMAEQAQVSLSARCHALGHRTGLIPREVHVRNYRRKWGQCSVTGVITLNWRVLHLSPELQDYIIIHELCHLAEMNHGKAFWSLVSKNCPEYKACRDSLAGAYPYLIW